MESFIRENIEVIREKIARAAEKAGRDPKDVLLLAVTKTIDNERIREAVDAGLCELGENKVQEIMDKYDTLCRDVKWHMIGHLQTNKVKYIIDKVTLIHSVDSLKLAEEINKKAAKAEKVMDILVEINVADEESKFGITCDVAEDIIRKLSTMHNIRVRGLMTVAPFVEDGEQNRPVFVRLRQLLVDINAKKIDNVNMDILSMGMTGDYEVAVEEGATIVRVGTGIFGPRVYL
ncbi:MAG: YggS family pyridoxal phosphate-dependent enzyme [Lachnospiraceae bacterium]|nr:YggS family pyridoxal phosphate-dependent enzyme [Lachnospiraceae bacterium]